MATITVRKSFETVIAGCRVTPGWELSYSDDPGVTTYLPRSGGSFTSRQRRNGPPAECQTQGTCDRPFQALAGLKRTLKRAYPDAVIVDATEVAS